IDAADHGSGAATAGQGLTADGAGGAARKGPTGGGAFAETIGDNSNTSFQVQHNLGTQDLVVQLWDLTGAEPIEATGDASQLKIDDDNNITVTFSAAPATDSYRVLILASGGSAGVRGGDLITEWNYRNPGRSSSAFAWKGNEFTPYVDLELYGMGYFGDLVAGATYQAAVITGTGSPGNIASITKSASVTLPGSLAKPDGVLWFKFASPVTLTAGTTYGLIVGRTDSTDTYALPVAYNGGTDAHNAVPMPGASHGRGWRVAKANPDVGDAINLDTANSVSAGYMFRLL